MGLTKTNWNPKEFTEGQLSANEFIGSNWDTKVSKEANWDSQGPTDSPKDKEKGSIATEKESQIRCSLGLTRSNWASNSLQRLFWGQKR